MIEGYTAARYLQYISGQTPRQVMRELGGERKTQETAISDIMRTVNRAMRYKDKLPR